MAIIDLVVLYAPVVFVYLMQIIGFIQSARKLKRVDIKGDVKKLLTPVQQQLFTLNERLEMAIELNKDLQKENNRLREEYRGMSVGINNKIAIQNQTLTSLVKKNVEWEGKARLLAKEVRHEHNNEEV